MTYITVDDFKSYLGIPDSEHRDEVELQKAIDQAVAIIDSFTGRTFKAVTATRYYDAVRDVYGRVLLLDRELAELTSVVNDGVTLSESDYVTLPPNKEGRDGPIWAIKLLASSGKRWTWTTDPEQAIEVTGKWGYSTTPPKSIVFATYKLADFLYRGRDTVGNARAASNRGAFPTLADWFPDEVALILERFKRTQVVGI